MDRDKFHQIFIWSGGGIVVLMAWFIFTPVSLTMGGKQVLYEPTYVKYDHVAAIRGRLAQAAGKKRQGDAANRSAIVIKGGNIRQDGLVIGWLRSCSTAAEIFYTREAGRYPQSFEEMTAQSGTGIDNRCGREYAGFRIDCYFAREGYVFSASPLVSGETGGWTHTVSNGGVLTMLSFQEAIAALQNPEVELSPADIARGQSDLQWAFSQISGAEFNLQNDLSFELRVPVPSMVLGYQVLSSIQNSQVFEYLKVRDPQRMPAGPNTLILEGKLKKSAVDSSEWPGMIDDLKGSLSEIAANAAQQESLQEPAQAVQQAQTLVEKQIPDGRVLSFLFLESDHVHYPEKPGLSLPQKLSQTVNLKIEGKMPLADIVKFFVLKADLRVYLAQQLADVPVAFDERDVSFQDALNKLCLQSGCKVEVGEDAVYIYSW